MAGGLLVLQHLTKCFGRVRAVDDLSLEVTEGEVFTLLGPSGCGKTTVLRLIAGLESPDQGRILLGERPMVSTGERIAVPSRKRNMGMVFQSYAVWPHKSVFANVAYPLQVRHVPRHEVQKRVLHVLELVGMLGLEGRQATQLSGGQQQRVALARALVYEPSVLLLDEPFSNLDAKLRQLLRVQLKLLLRQVRTTVIFVTHDQEEALTLSDRVAVMHQGRLEQAGPPKDLYERPSTPFVRDFVGRTVVLQGNMDGRAPNGLLQIRLKALPDTMLYAEATRGVNRLQAGPVSVAIRPEDIHLDSAVGERSPGNQLTGTVGALLFTGDRYECRVDLGGQESVLIHAPRSTRLLEGQSIRLYVDPQDITVWAS